MAQSTLLRSCRASQLTYSHFSWAGLVSFLLVRLLLSVTDNYPSSISGRGRMAEELISIAWRGRVGRERGPGPGPGLCSVVVTSSVYPHINITYICFYLVFSYFLEFVRHLCGRNELYTSTSRKKQRQKKKR